MFLKLKEDLSCTQSSWKTKASLQEHKYFFVFSTWLILLKHSSAIKNSLGEKKKKKRNFHFKGLFCHRIPENKDLWGIPVLCLSLGAQRLPGPLWEGATGCWGGRVEAGSLCNSRCSPIHVWAENFRSFILLMRNLQLWSRGCVQRDMKVSFAKGCAGVNSCYPHTNSCSLWSQLTAES